MDKKRARIYFDSIDLEILELLNNRKNEQNNYEGSYQVLEVAEKLNLNHKNLKPHIDKLRKLDLIFVYSDSNNRILLSTPSAYFDFLNEIDYYTDGGGTEKEYKREKEKKERFENIIGVLREVRKIYIEEKQSKILELDLRKVKSLKQKQINYSSELKKLQKNESKLKKQKKAKTS